MTNPHFNPWLDDRDASLIYDLSDELIYNCGIDIEYLSREVMRHDPILNEPLSSQFNEVFPLDALIEQTENFFAGNEMFGAAGLQFNFNSSSLSISRRKFIEMTQLQEPREGDLVFIKANRMLFEIVNVNSRDPIISGGRLFTFTIYLQPYAAGEGSASFEKSKFKGSDDLANVLDEFLGSADQTTWTKENEAGEQVPLTDVENMEAMEERMPNFSQNKELEDDSSSKIVNGTNPFGFV